VVAIGSGVLANGGIMAGASIANLQYPGPDCIITASPPSVVFVECVLHPAGSNSTCPTPGITKGPEIYGIPTNTSIESLISDSHTASFPIAVNTCPTAVEIVPINGANGTHGAGGGIINISVAVIICAINLISPQPIFVIGLSVLSGFEHLVPIFAF
jgi:hypothetical protein